MSVKTVVAALSAFIFLIVVATAGAAPRGVDVKDVAKTRAEVRAHWTAERMREAVPVTPEAQGEQVAPNDTTAEPPPADTDLAPAAPAPTSFPFSSGEYQGYYPGTYGRVFFTDDGIDYVCSGTAINSQNRSVVWTAGHCVNDGPGAFHTNWMFIPAYRDGVRPYGTWTARELLTTNGWGQRGDISYDLGAAVMSASGGVALNDAVGGLGIAFDAPREQTYTAFGYPAAPPFTGERLRTCTSAYGASDPGTVPSTMAIGCDMTGGASGGGWVVGNAVHSVVSYGYGDQPNVIYGPYQSTEARALFDAAAAR
jgi:hypothetical protein